MLAGAKPSSRHLLLPSSPIAHWHGSLVQMTAWIVAIEREVWAMAVLAAGHGFPHPPRALFACESDQSQVDTLSPLNNNGFSPTVGGILARVMIERSS